MPNLSFILVDSYFKLLEVVPMSFATSETITVEYFCKTFSNHRIPEIFMSDMAYNF